MDYHALSLKHYGWFFLALGIFLSLLIKREKPNWPYLMDLFSRNPIRNWKAEHILLFALRKIASFFIYSGIFLLVVATV